MEMSFLDGISLEPPIGGKIPVQDYVAGCLGDAMQPLGGDSSGFLSVLSEGGLALISQKQWRGEGPEKRPNARTNSGSWELWRLR